ncbi:helix-turn-helix domain-containing protein, partial [Bifidobacterium longum]
MNRIRECRRNKKLTLKQLSKELAKKKFKISADALGKYERGEREPK